MDQQLKTLDMKESRLVFKPPKTHKNAEQAWQCTLDPESEAKQGIPQQAV